jgi:acyl carrier protein
VSDDHDLSTVAGARPADGSAAELAFEQTLAFIINALRQMHYKVDGFDADTMLGPAGMDLESLAVVELSYRLDDAYGARFNEDDMEQLAVMTLGGLATEVQRRATP